MKKHRKKCEKTLKKAWKKHWKSVKKTLKNAWKRPSFRLMNGATSTDFQLTFSGSGCLYFICFSVIYCRVFSHFSHVISTESQWLWILQWWLSEIPQTAHCHTDRAPPTMSRLNPCRGPIGKSLQMTISLTADQHINYSSFWPGRQSSGGTFCWAVSGIVGVGWSEWWDIFDWVKQAISWVLHGVGVPLVVVVVWASIAKVTRGVVCEWPVGNDKGRGPCVWGMWSGWMRPDSEDEGSSIRVELLWTAGIITGDEERVAGGTIDDFSLGCAVTSMSQIDWKIWFAMDDVWVMSDEACTISCCLLQSSRWDSARTGVIVASEARDCPNPDPTPPETTKSPRTGPKAHL